MYKFSPDVYELIEKYSINGIQFEYMGQDEALVIDTKIIGDLKWDNNKSRLHFQISKGQLNIGLDKLRDTLLPIGLYPFISEYYKDNRLSTPEKLSIIPYFNQFDVVKFQYTHGTNFGFTNEDVLNKLKDFNNRFGIQIYGASENWCLVLFEKLPTDLSQLIEEVLKFAPNSIRSIQTRFENSNEIEHKQLLADLLGYQKFIDLVW